MREWAAELKDLARPCTKRSLWQLMTTVLPLVGIWIAMILTLDVGYWLTLALSVPAAGLVVRLFMIQHDCGHYSFFKSRRANDLLGWLIGIFTLTPHGYWRNAHAVHHASSGNLARRGIGDIFLLTVREYQALPRLRRLAYRLYRSPPVMFGIGPIYVFVLKFRLPLDMLRKHRGLLPGVLVTNLVIVSVLATLGLLVGFADLALVQAPVTIIAGLIGVWLFFVQHQFETTQWAEAGEWDFHHAAVAGSSHYDLPPVLRWFTANIGFHHIHHLCSRVPNYRLRDCMKRIPEFAGINRITLRDSLKCIPLALWDEEAGRLISFRTLSGRTAQESG